MQTGVRPLTLTLTCAQALLWFGIKRSKRAPTKMHPYGYMRDKFVFSLISAVGIFCLGAGVSVWNGVSGLMAATPVEHVGWSIAGTPRRLQWGPELPGQMLSRLREGGYRSLLGADSCQAWSAQLKTDASDCTGAATGDRSP